MRRAARALGWPRTLEGSKAAINFVRRERENEPIGAHARPVGVRLSMSGQMSTKQATKTTRELVLIVHPSRLKTEAQHEAFVDRAVDTLLDLMDEYARKTGTQPLR